jgi:DNA-binding transcriptional ArsR family regulator
MGEGKMVSESILQAIKCSAITLLTLGHYPGRSARMLALILEMDYHTIQRHITQLRGLGLVDERNCLLESGWGMLDFIHRPVDNFGGGWVQNALRAEGGAGTEGIKRAQNVPTAGSSERESKVLNSKLSTITITSDSEDKVVEVTGSRAQKALIKALSEYHVIYNQRVRAIKDLTAEAVHGHAQSLLKRGKSFPKDTGLLITLLESGGPAPEVNKYGHLKGCECVKCGSRSGKYIDGEWGQFIEH